MVSFSERLRSACQAVDSLLCVGLDPDPERLPEPFAGRSTGDVLGFNAAIIRATSGAAAAYKLNLAFYESMGGDGWRVLEETLLQIPSGRIVIADGKRGDIGSSAAMYARSAFVTMDFDACTVSPYMGADSVQPFLEYAGKAAFVLCITSNPGAADLQKKRLEDQLLYEAVAEQAERWSADMPGTVGLVVGATNPGEMAGLRKQHPEMPFLVPGVGAQGGDPGEVIQAAGTAATLINVSRQIMYAASGRDFEEAAARVAAQFKSRMPAR